MVDVVDRETRSRMMAGIRGKNTKPEMVLRRALHARGLRYVVHDGRLPGRPDLVLPRYRAAVFVHGCFWHRHAGCRLATTPATRADFWEAKLSGNAMRDSIVREELAARGWRVAIVWECSLRKEEQVHDAADRVLAWLQTPNRFIEIDNLSVNRENVGHAECRGQSDLPPRYEPASGSDCRFGGLIGGPSPSSSDKTPLQMRAPVGQLSLLPRR